MKKYRFLTYLFAVFAVLLSDAMCAHVAYTYCDMLWGGRYALYSAPANVAFFLMIPYGIGILLCASAAWIFHRK